MKHSISRDFTRENIQDETLHVEFIHLAIRQRGSYACLSAQLTSQWLSIMAFGTFIWQLVAVGVLVCIGVVWNTFNLIVTIQQQLRTKGIQTISLIIFSFSISNITLVLSCFFIVMCVCLNPSFLCTRLQSHFLMLLYMWLSSSCVSFWSIALLSVFHCVKVVSFSSCECLCTLKRNISFITNTALLLICIGSFLLFLPFLTLHSPGSEPGTRSTTHGTNNTLNTTNATCLLPIFTPLINTQLYSMSFLSFLCPFPLMIMLPTSIRMVIYLCQHTVTLNKNQIQVQSLDSYMFVCKLNISLVGVYLITLAIVAFFFILKMMASNVSYLIIIFGFSFYCIMTAALSTASTKKLRETFCRLFCCSKIQEQMNKGTICVKETKGEKPT
ncbi:uncharacterized protein [Salminus brasiliensis]|uniref:uncharacterized protein n=1 Tax=Salminus brasiliensis TaxID=930266 RepID=UPI003B82DE7F